MKILIAAQGSDLNGKIDKRFGHSKYFIIFDTSTATYKSIPNAAEGGVRVGLDAIVDEGVEAVITGNIGPNAFERLKSLGIPVYIVRGVTVKEALEKIASGELQPSTEPTMKKSVHEGDHFGQGLDDHHDHHHGYGMGRGRGMGRGYGRGMGSGHGRGGGHGHHEDH